MCERSGLENVTENKAPRWLRYPIHQFQGKFWSFVDEKADLWKDTFCTLNILAVHKARRIAYLDLLAILLLVPQW